MCDFHCLVMHKLDKNLIPNIVIVVKVMVEIAAIKDLPVRHQGNLFVTLRKAEPDVHFNTKTRLSIQSESGYKQVASFHCELEGELVFELMLYTTYTKSETPLGRTSVSLTKLLEPGSPLWMDDWFELLTDSENLDSSPISIRIAMSFTPPVPMEYMLQMIPANPSMKSARFLPLLRRTNLDRSWTVIQFLATPIMFSNCVDAVDVQERIETRVSFSGSNEGGPGANNHNGSSAEMVAGGACSSCGGGCSGGCSGCRGGSCRGGGCGGGGGCSSRCSGGR